jgi:hypothetical protein
MRALLDVNVLVALLDGGHLHHRPATAWLAEHVDRGWASCPITQNGCLRILSLPGYPNPQPTAQVAQRLATAMADRSHLFWPDDVSLLDKGRLRWDRVLGPRQLTDLYLLTLAVRHDGTFVTLDQAIDPAAVPGATPEHLTVIGGPR